MTKKPRLEVEEVDQESSSKIVIPSWANERFKWGEKIVVPEWDDFFPDDTANGEEEAYCGEEFRKTNGWKGTDLIHHKSSAIRVLEYRLHHHIPPTPTETETEMNDTNLDSVPNQIYTVGSTTLTGIVHFTKNAESHKNHCHGGSMTSVFDDIIGWTGFCCTGKIIEWSGFTVQVNTKLKYPIKVDSVLKITCTVTRIEKNRKVFMTAKLFDPDVDEGERIHGECEGLVILNRGVIS